MKPRFEWIIFILALGVCTGLTNPNWTHGQEESTTVTNKLSGRFEPFLGSSENSRNAVTGLRGGTSFEYTDSTGTTTITPETGEMGYGGVSHSLRLAEFQLNKAGITDPPTAEQLNAALNGGTLTASDGSTIDAQGVLALRSEGKGWGQIAQELGTKMGAIVGKGKAAQHGLESGQASSTESLSGRGEGTGNASTSATASGIVSGSGKSSGKSYGKGIVSGKGNAYGHSTKGTRESGIVSGSSKPSGQTYGKGIVSGGGKAYGHSSGGTYGKGIVSGSGRSIGAGDGSGIVTGSGRSSPSHGRVSAGGGYKSHGGGQGKNK